MISLSSAYCTTFFCNKVRTLLMPWGRVSCISKTTCFSVNCTPLSLQFGRNEEPKGSNGSCPSEYDNQTPPSKSDTAPFLRAKPQPIRGFPAIKPVMFRHRQWAWCHTPYKSEYMLHARGTSFWDWVMSTCLAPSFGLSVVDWEAGLL